MHVLDKGRVRTPTRLRLIQLRLHYRTELRRLFLHDSDDYRCPVSFASLRICIYTRILSIAFYLGRQKERREFYRALI